MGESLVRENIFTFYVNGFITLPPPFASDLQNSDPWPLTKIYLCLLHINAQVPASKRHKTYAQTKWKGTTTKEL
jgi:hypothetical protein